jgi:HK97 family phage prohead protease
MPDLWWHRAHSTRGGIVNERILPPSDTTMFRAFPTTELVIGRSKETGFKILTGRVVPFNEVAQVVDYLPTGPDLYDEGFRPGAFENQVNSKKKGVFTKIGLIHRHDGGMGYLGPFVHLREQSDGLWGDVQIMPTLVDNVEALLAAGIDELSVEFRLPTGDISSHTRVDDAGVRWRIRAHLDQVALEPKGAYRTAQVISMRAERDTMQREAEAAAEKEAKAAAEEEERKAEEVALAAKKAEEEAARRAIHEEERKQAEAARAELDAQAEARILRRQRFEEMTKRVDDDNAKQRELADRFGIKPPNRR